jgi:hypothetical protein
MYTTAEEERPMTSTETIPSRMSWPARIAAGVALALVALAVTQPGKAHATTICSWAGTPLAPTGWFTLDPGVTMTPSAGPLRFVAWGDLAGSDPRCRGQMKWIGQADAGATCALLSFEGEVKGLPGVARFWGKGSLLVPSYLYDKYGNLVGVENANIMTQHNQSLTATCAEPGGFTGPADFSSTIVLF